MRRYENWLNDANFNFQFQFAAFLGEKFITSF